MHRVKADPGPRPARAPGPPDPSRAATARVAAILAAQRWKRVERGKLTGGRRRR